MTLDAVEFIRRFLLHVLPRGFQRMRHYGFLAHGQRKVKLVGRVNDEVVASCEMVFGLVERRPSELPPVPESMSAE